MLDQTHSRLQTDLALVVFMALVFVGVERLFVLF